MIEVEILNFQSIEAVSVRIAGFTAIVGRSNIGKSAIVRAIKCALTAPKGTDFVRHGEKCERRIKGNKKCHCHAKVTFKTPERTVVWEKGDAINQYTVTEGDAEPVLYTAINHGTPDFLKPEFEPMKIGSGSPDLIQVSEQFKPIFLLDQAGPATADVLSDVAKLDDINKATSLVNKDRKEANATRKVREKDVARLNKTLEGYEGLDEAVAKAKAVEAQQEALGAKQKHFEWVSERVLRLKTLAPVLKGLMAATKPELPGIEDVTAKGEKTIQAHAFYAELTEKGPVFRKLLKIDKVAMPELAPLVAQGKLFVQVSEWLEHLNTFKKVGRQVKLVENAKLPEAPGDLSKLEQIQGFLDRLSALQTDERQLSVEHHKAVAELKTAEEEFGQLGVCPTCTQRIEAGHVHRAVSA